MSNIIAIHQAHFKDAPYHVHAEGCRDIAKYRRYALTDIGPAEQFTSLQSMVEDYYGNQMDESDSPWTAYAPEFKVFPCVGWQS